MQVVSKTLDQIITNEGNEIQCIGTKDGKKLEITGHPEEVHLVIDPEDDKNICFSAISWCNHQNNWQKLECNAWKDVLCFLSRICQPRFFIISAL